jgi:hypothetical protein
MPPARGHPVPASALIDFIPRHRFLRHALRGEFAVSLLDLDTDGVALAVFRNPQCGPRPHEWIKDCLAWY